ncbi:MAG: type II secretion system protein [Candidatus Paceibacterota bacterium]
MSSFRNKEKGFTLIEMIVSLGVFSFVVVIAVGALLSVIATNRQLQAEQSVMTNLAFALDSMTREIRTGYAYVCGDVDSVNTPVMGGQTKIFDSGSNDHKVSNMDDTYTNDCTTNSQNYRGLSFIEGGDSITNTGSNQGGRILYYYDASQEKLLRRVEYDAPQSITSSGLNITKAEFIVTGTDTNESNGDIEQPTVTVYLEAVSDDDPTGKTYHLETTVTQRILDL